ncbi:uncharacterized protein LOC135699366 [Ochlerotatus camptorhynchus]|uniref:uncharacterized protein LOC135699366 n=1 Tax=Ochlerotatus camptorhynchus TaxID=644619 RepID=UPI0031D28A30
MDPQLVGASMPLESQSKVQDFYRGSTILIAGGTGFVGKPLLEKILRSLTVKKVYLLIRSTRGASAEDRFERLLEDRLFDLVREQVGKVEPVEVDYDRSGFGLQGALAERLQKEVQVVFYCLADVKFNQPLKEAIRTNVRIGRDVLSWCRSFSNLKAIVHTSTFYSDCNKCFVEEKVSDELPFGNYKLCMKMAEDLSRDEGEKIKETVLGDYPNTYAYTKKLAEVMIEKEFARDLPIGIYRPPVGKCHDINFVKNGFDRTHADPQYHPRTANLWLDGRTTSTESLSFWYAGFKDLMTVWLDGANGTDHYYYRRSLQRYALYNQAVAFIGGDGLQDEPPDEHLSKEAGASHNYGESSEMMRRKKTDEEHQRKIKAMKQLYKPPAVEEINWLKEPQYFYHSNLFRLQVKEVLSEVKGKFKVLNYIERWLGDFRKFLRTVKDADNERSLNDVDYEGVDFTLAFPDGSHVIAKESFKFVQQRIVHHVGSSRLGTSYGKPLKVDLLLEIPDKCFRKEDYLNLITLTHIFVLVKSFVPADFYCAWAARLREHEFIRMNIEIPYLNYDYDRCLDLIMVGAGIHPLAGDEPWKRNCLYVYRLLGFYHFLMALAKLGFSIQNLDDPEGLFSSVTIVASMATIYAKAFTLGHYDKAVRQSKIFVNSNFGHSGDPGFDKTVQRDSTRTSGKVTLIIMDDIRELGVAEFYRNSVILITGATGFAGQVLLEKILRSLEPRKIYVLVRSKRNANGHQRMHRLLASVLFDKVRSHDLPSRVIPLEVDFEQENLSIDESLRETLANEVNVVFNLLASINFNDPISSALKTNVEYPRKLLQLVNTFHHLKSMMHVSTFYSNFDQSTIEEKIYEDTHFGGYENVQRILAHLNQSEKDALTPLILGKLPNTYTYTKKCTESMIQDSFSHLPIGIFRPPIITSTYREPIQGWYYKYNGPCGLMLAIYNGLLRVMPFDFSKKPFLAPVDYCANGILCCAVDVFKKHRSTVQVYNFTDDTRNCNWKEVYYGYVNGMKPFSAYVNGRFLTITSDNHLLCCIAHGWMRLQAAFVDWIFWVFWKKQRAATATVERIISLSNIVKPFSVNDWGTENCNMIKVIGELNPQDRELFPCDLRDIDWKPYLEGFIPGVLKYVVGKQQNSRHAESSADR